MYLHEKGDVGAPTILFLHGNASSGRTWDFHTRQLSKACHCLAPDLPGFGYSSQQKWISLNDTTAQVIQIVREHAAGGRVHLVGLSLGGSIGIDLLGKAPELIDHAIIDGTGVLPFRSTPLLTAGFFLVQPFLKTEFFARAVAKGLNVPAKGYQQFEEDFHAMSPRAFRRSFYEGMSLKIPAGIEKVTCPTLFVAGELEFPRFHQSNLLMSRLMPNAECRSVSGMGHSWLFEAPDLHCRMVRAWIEGEELPGELIEVNSVFVGEKQKRKFIEIEDGKHATTR